MSDEKLRSMSFVCAIVIIAAAVVEIIVIALIVYSASNDTFLSGAPDFVIGIVGYSPWAALCAAGLLRFYFNNKIKENESNKTEDRIKELERQIERLKGK